MTNPIAAQYAENPPVKVGVTVPVPLDPPQEGMTRADRRRKQRRTQKLEDRMLTRGPRSPNGGPAVVRTEAAEDAYPIMPYTGRKADAHARMKYNITKEREIGTHPAYGHKQPEAVYNQDWDKSYAERVKNHLARDRQYLRDHPMGEGAVE